MSVLKDRLTTMLQDFIQKGVPGCACSVLRGGQTLAEAYEGYADLEAGKPIAPDTIYRIYSMSKVITCTSALMLYERGLFALNDPLHEYLPEFRDMQVFRHSPNGSISTSPAAGPIRVRDLFTMSSGYPYPGEDNETGRRLARELEAQEKAEPDKQWTLRDFTRALATVPLAFDPGTRWLYGFSHDILGAFVETVSGKRFGQFLQDEIFAPLGMADTSFHIAQGKRDRLCCMYDRADDGKLTKNTGMDDGYQPGAAFESGGGGLLSTLGDYQRFAQAMAGAGDVRLLSPHTVRLMASNHLSAQQMADYNWVQLAGYGYGLGVRVLTDPAAGGSSSTPGEFGWMGLAGTIVYIDPKEQLSIVYAQQMLPNQEVYHLPRVRSVVYGAI